ncbi:MAG TPA: hypothetical protein VII27_08725 [Thermoplasmata archaeon]
MNAIRAYADRVRALGWPLLVTGLAVLLGLVALSQPVWVYERRTPGGDVDRSTFGWTMVVEEQWDNGVWSSTTWIPYSNPNFPDLRVRDVVGTSYLMGVLALISLVVLGGLQYLSRTRRIHPLVFLVAGGMALGFCAFAILYPMLAIPPAAALDMNGAIAGFSGTAPGPGNQVYAWGAGASWWLWIASTLLTLVVFVVPLAQRRSWSRPHPAH